jgi:predicted TIM-barrel fold metal-dependent hydrolase
MKRILAFVVLAIPVMLVGQAGPPAGRRAPIIDMHLHAMPADVFGPPGQPNPATGKPSSAITDDEIRRQSLAALVKYNVVRAATSGLEHVASWKAAMPERVIPALAVADADKGIDVAKLRKEVQAGRVAVFGEIIAQYEGYHLGDKVYEPLLALAEELDVPVAIHTGFGPPGVTYQGSPRFRARLGNPLLIEDALVRHPKLRIYLMHAGYPFLEETIALMHAHPQVYADVGIIDWGLKQDDFYAYLRALVRHQECHIEKRLMFGSDQMIWPEAIGMAIERVETAPFLTATQKRDIFCNNAARFLRLDVEKTCR